MSSPDERPAESGVEFKTLPQYDAVKNNTFTLFVECERHLRECLYDVARNPNELPGYQDRFVGSLLTLYFDILAKENYIKEVKHVGLNGKTYDLDDLLKFLRNPSALDYREALEYFILLRKFLEKQGVLFVETARYKPEEMIVYGLEKRQ